MLAGIGHNNPPEPLRIPLRIGAKFLSLFGPEQYKAYYGGRGSAKSHSIATTIPIKMASGHRRVVCARQFQNSIRDSSKEVIELKIHELGLTNQFKIYEREIVHLHYESRATFIGLDRNPESAKSLEGGDTWWIEEARTINARSLEILLPTIRKPGSEAIFSWNPEQPEDPVDDFFRGTHSKRTNPNWIPPFNAVIQRVGIEDNPWFYHTAMPEQMWHMLQGNPLRYAHIWGGEYDESYDTKIFTDVVVSAVEVGDSAVPRYGIDFSQGGNDPYAIVKLYINHQRKEIYIAREFVGRIALAQLPQAIDTVIEKKSDEIFADHLPVTIEHLTSQGYNVTKAAKGPGSVNAGISWLQGYKIYIDPACEHMRDEARLYSWQVDKLTKKILKVPVDAHNHMWDAVRYACSTAMSESTTHDPHGGVIRLKMGNR